MSYRNKPELEVSRISLDMRAIASAFRVPERAAGANMADGRAMSFWAPWWASGIYGLAIDTVNLEQNTQALVGDMGTLDAPRAMIRTLGVNRVCFQRNQRIGKGRSCSQQELIQDLRGYERCIVVCIDRAPTIELYPLPARSLYDEAVAGDLSPNGITQKAFRGWVGERFRVVYADIALGGPLAAAA